MICRGATQLDPLNHSWCSRWSQLCVRPFPAVPRGTGAAAALQRKRRNLGRGGASARGRGWLCLHSKEDCVKLYHWSNWSKCFKEVEHQEPPATWHTHTPCQALPYQRWQAWEAWREQPQGRAEWIHICIYGPLMRCMGPVGGKCMGERV